MHKYLDKTIDWVLKLSKIKLIIYLTLLYVGIRLIDYLICYYQTYLKYKKVRSIQKDKIDLSVKEIKQMINQHPLDDTKKELLKNADAYRLVELMTSKQLTSVDILIHYLERCITIGLQLNAVTDFNHHEALEMAQMCDMLRKVTPPGRLPKLFGLPISLKSNYVQKGFDTSIGLMKFYDKVHQTDGEIVAVLKKIGCIPFVRSNLPSGVCATENLGYVYGTIQNPVEVFPQECQQLGGNTSSKMNVASGDDENERLLKDPSKINTIGQNEAKSFESGWNPNDFRVKWGKRCAGGSSGGEAALVAAKCSPLGWGTDAAGSLRTPTYFCGVNGFMTSINRITMNGE